MIRSRSLLALGLAFLVAGASAQTPLPVPQPRPAGPASAGPASVPSPPRVTGTAWLLMDHTSGQVLAGENIHARVEPASITKVMTSYVLAAELLAHGVDLSFTPVLDLDYGCSRAIGNRAFHRDPAVIAALAQALVAGRLAGWLNGLAPTDIGYTNLSAGYIRYRDLALRGGWPAFLRLSFSALSARARCSGLPTL